MTENVEIVQSNAHDKKRFHEGLRELLESGESEKVDFRVALPAGDRLARTLIAFANGKGGVSFIGVSHVGTIAGLNSAELNQTLYRLREMVESLFGGMVGPEKVAGHFGSLTVSGKKVAYVTVESAPSSLLPITDSSGRVFVRKGSATVEGSLPTSPKRPKNSRTKSVKVFVAMSFKSEEEPALEDYYRAMQRAVKTSALPIDVVRMDEINADFEISQEIMERIDVCDVVITDFTLSPSNVYFELGYARGRKKRIIQTARTGTTLEFDVRNWHTVFYRNATELEAKLINELANAYSDIVNAKS